LRLGLTYLDSLERIVKEASANGEHEKITKIVDQLCHEYAYAVHQPHARNGGLIGLAAASIALGTVGRGWELRLYTPLIGLAG
jgi:vacuole morphology and inheritance protein 14